MILENVKVRFNDKVAAFILGLSVCEGITTFLKIGSTAFTLSEIIAPLLFLYFLVTRTDDIKEFTSLLENILE